MKYLIYLLIGLAIWLLLNKLIFSKFKLPKIGAITLFTGGVKTGKSAVSLYFAIKTFKRVHRRWKISCFIVKIINFFLPKSKQKAFPEEPLFYSTIPICGIKYNQITREHFLRQVRFNFKSVLFIDEASLVADSTLIKDQKVNLELLTFFKLFGHSTHGGTCIINTHCITDLHFAIKRTTSEYFYIHSLSNYFFFLVANCREERYSEDGTDLNVFTEDVEKSLVKVFLSRKIFKKYDCYAFSYLTDHLALKNLTYYKTKYDSLKANQIPSFRGELYELGEKFNEKT